MNLRYKLEMTNDKNQTIIKDYKSLKEISKELNVEVHLIRKINQLTEERCENIKPHHIHKELYDKIKIYTLKKHYNI
jgi:hypothetical protein